MSMIIRWKKFFQEKFSLSINSKKKLNQINFNINISEQNYTTLIKVNTLTIIPIDNSAIDSPIAISETTLTDCTSSIDTLIFIKGTFLFTKRSSTIKTVYISNFISSDIDEDCVSLILGDNSFQTI